MTHRVVLENILKLARDLGSWEAIAIENEEILAGGGNIHFGHESMAIVRSHDIGGLCALLRVLEADSVIPLEELDEVIGALRRVLDCHLHVGMTIEILEKRKIK